MASHYLIDAYNVIHKSTLLRPVARDDLERARDMLLDFVQCFCLTGDYEVTVVFDGREEDLSRETVPLSGKAKGMHLLFSPHHTTADTVIERLVYQQHNRINCIVVSNDRGLKDQCRGMGALTMEADSFLASVRQVQQGAKELLNKKQQPKATLLEDQLSADNIRILEALKDKLAAKQPQTPLKKPAGKKKQQ